MFVQFPHKRIPIQQIQTGEPENTLCRTLSCEFWHIFGEQMETNYVLLFFFFSVGYHIQDQKW